MKGIKTLYKNKILFLYEKRIKKVKRKMEEDLYEKTERHFEVSEVEERVIKGEVFYRARIHPKSLTETNEGNSSYYYTNYDMDIFWEIKNN